MLTPTQTLSRYDRWTNRTEKPKEFIVPYDIKSKKNHFLEPHLWLGDGFCNVCNVYHGKLSQQCYAWCTGEYFLQYSKSRCEVLDHFKVCTKNDHSNCYIFTKVFT